MNIKIKLKKEHLAIVVILILIVSLSFIIFSANLKRLLYESQMLGWNNSEQKLGSAHIKGEILAYFKGNLTDSVLRGKIDSYGLQLKDYRITGKNETFTLAHIIVPVDKERLWLRILSEREAGNIECLNIIRDYAKQETIQRVIMNDFAESVDVVKSTMPYKEKYKRCEEIRSVISIKKTYVVDGYEYFASCIGPMNIITCPAPTDNISIRFVDDNIEFLFETFTTIENRGDIKFLDFTVFIPPESQNGLYGYKVYACAVKDYTEKCSGLKKSYGEFDFIVQVTGT